MKLIQKGVTRIILSPTELLDCIHTLTGFKAASGSQVQFLVTDETGNTLLAELQPGHAITVQFTEDQKEEDHGASRSKN